MDETGNVTALYGHLNWRPIFKMEQDQLFFYHTDHLGTPMYMTDEDGKVVWEGKFMPFGEELNVSTIIENNIRLPGQYHDEDTGLHYNYFRYYDPDIGRYLRPDPIGFTAGLYDQDTGLIRLGLMEYAAQVSRWPAKESILLLGGDLDPYNYLVKNPLNLIDPYGLRVGGILIPIRKAIKQSGATWVDAFFPTISKIINIPTSPIAIILYDFINPSEAGDPCVDMLTSPCSFQYNPDIYLPYSDIDFLINVDIPAVLESYPEVKDYQRIVPREYILQ